MVKKRQKKIRKPAGPKEMSTERLERKAGENLREHRFKAAVGDFKELLRRESTPERLEALAEAYVGRAEELVAKGMLKEALTIWQNRSEICGKPLNEAAHLELLIETGDWDKAGQWLGEQLSPQAEASAELPEVRRLCAARILGGADQLLAPWPEDDQLRKDLPHAELALEAYCVGNDRALEEALAAIPFRSPFRELKGLFKALLELPGNAPAALRHLAKIDADSPFLALGEGIRRAAEPSGLTAMEQSPPQAFANALLGRNQALTVATADFTNEKNKVSPVRLLDLLAKHRQILGEAYATEAAKRLVVHDEVHGEQRLVSEFDRLFGRPEPFEQYRINVLVDEVAREDPESILDAWRKIIAKVPASQAFRSEDPGLVQAMIYRHMAELALKFHDLRSEAADALDQALRHDPDDREGHILLIRLRRDSGDLKAAREIAGRAEERWPEDPGVLTQSVRNAIASQAFQKAARMSRRVLELDPVNSEIKGVLFDAHLSHARKQIGGGKAHLAANELERAAEWASTSSARGRLDLLAGILAWVREDQSELKPRLSGGCERLGPLSGRFVLTLEAFRLGQDPKALMRAGGIPQRPPRIEASDLLNTAVEIDTALSDEGGRRPLRLAVQGLMPNLKTGAKLALDESQWIRLCETWLRDPELRRSLLPAYAKAALKRYPQALTLRFFLLEAKRTPGSPMGFELSDDMLELMHEARQAGDSRLAGRIERVMIEDEELSPRRHFLPLFGDEDDDEDDDELEQMDLFDEEDDFSPLDNLELPPGVDPGQLIDVMLSAGMPKDVRNALEQMKEVFGGALSERDILEMLLFRGSKGAPPLPAAPRRKANKNRGRRKK